MKISKIKNSRPGISVFENKSEEQFSKQSFLYYAPKKNGKVRLKSNDLRKHVMDCNKNAQNLYNVINPEFDFCKDKNRKKVFEDLAKNFNLVLCSALRSVDTSISDPEERAKKEAAFILNMDKEGIKTKKDSIKSENLIVKFPPIDEDNGTEKTKKAESPEVKEQRRKEQEAEILKMTEELVLRKLKKTLRRNAILDDKSKMQMTEIATNLMKAICVYGNAGSFDPVILKAFFKEVDKDYMKDEQMEEIVRSIESQSVKVKVAEKDGRYLLLPANADHRKKKYAFEFMRKYAAAEAERKQKLTEHVQALIGLYLCGESEYQNAKNCFYDMVENHECMSGEIEEIYNTIKELKNLSRQKREERKEIKEKIRKIEKSGKGDKRTPNNNSNKSYKNDKKDNDNKENDINLNENDLQEAIKEIDKELAKIPLEICINNEKLNNAVIKTMSVKYRAAVKYLVSKVKKTVLGEIKEKKDCSCADLYWIDYIDNTVKKLLLDSRNKGMYRYEISFLSNHIWKEWTQYISGKYIELGKGVYHFAIPDLSGALEGKPVSVCEVKPEYRKGISGFDYERIKAEESLDREMEEYVLFAVNNFARAAAPENEREKPGHEDVLIMKTSDELIAENKKNQEPIVLYKDADRRILQFFGGQSRFREKEDSFINLYSGEDLYKEIRNELYTVRNITFHYTTKAEKGQIQKHEMAEYFFEEELADISGFFRKKYYSNNVWKFYDMEVINDLMDKIYSGRKYRAAQIPAFNNIISRPALPQIVNGFVKGNSLKKIMNYPDREIIKQYWSALFFVLKELYYYDFLQEQENPEENIRERFLRVLARKLEETSDAKEQKAWESFDKRISEIGRERSFGEICQGLMIEYMLQNNDSPMVRKENIHKRTKSRDTQIYKHYRTLLYICIRDAFIEYLKEKWQGLREPVLIKKEWSEEEFCHSDNVEHLSLYDHLKDLFHSTASGPSWYIAAHFINPKYLNHLIGSIRNYLQFTEDIERRAVSLGKCVDNEREEKNLRYRNTLEILEFVLQFCGKTTKVMEDYFESNEVYAAYLSDFVDYKTPKNITDIETALHIFCEQKVNVDGKENMVGIYYDGGNLIPNRNIIRANMYGNVSCLKASMDKIKYAEIRKMYIDKSKLDSVLKEGVCRTKEDQKALREFQNEKNRIELLDLSIYTEILNDMQAILIGWTYMRERDLMYYQLGYYYTKLFWTDSISEEDERRRLTGDEVNIEDGAILYQILAFNTYHLPVISNKKNTVSFVKDNGSIGGKALRAFFRNFENAIPIYLEGLNLFENTDEHDDIIDTRNYIEHFKYFIKSDRSMMDLYSEVYDRFFRHDHKLKKSVPEVLINVLARNFMDARIYMKLGSKQVVKEKTGVSREDKASKIAFTDKGIESTALTYTIKPDSEDNKKASKILVDARSEVFLKQFQKILEYRA